MPPRVFKGRKLLIASIGVAAVTYACNKEQPRPEPVGNLMAPMPMDSGAPAPTTDSADSGNAGPTKLNDIGVTSGNLVAPPPMPMDAGSPAMPDAGHTRRG